MVNHCSAKPAQNCRRGHCHDRHSFRRGGGRFGRALLSTGLGRDARASRSSATPAARAAPARARRRRRSAAAPRRRPPSPSTRRRPAASSPRPLPAAGGRAAAAARRRARFARRRQPSRRGRGALSQGRRSGGRRARPAGRPIRSSAPRSNGPRCACAAQPDDRRLAAFAAAHPQWPGGDWIRAVQEAHLYTERAAPSVVAALFAGDPPRTPAGKLAAARAALDAGRRDEATGIVRALWRDSDLDAWTEGARAEGIRLGADARRSQISRRPAALRRKDRAGAARGGARRRRRSRARPGARRGDDRPADGAGDRRRARRAARRSRPRCSRACRTRAAPIALSRPPPGSRARRARRPR